MVDVRQLELNLEVAFDEAAEVSESADVLSLWAQFEGDLAGLPQRDHLRILVKLAGLCEAKSDVLWEDWQDVHQQFQIQNQPTPFQPISPSVIAEFSRGIRGFRCLQVGIWNCWMCTTLRGQ